MNIKFYLSFLFIVFNFLLIVSQEETTNNNKGELIVSSSIGTSTLEAKNTFKINANVSEGFIGYEFMVNNKVSLISGLEILRIKADFNNAAGNQLFLTNNYINIPVLARLFLNREQKMEIFVDLGIYGSYLYKSKVEDIANNIKDTENGLGTSFGFQANIGAKYKVNEKLSISFGIKSKSDIVNSFKSSVQEFKLTDFYAFQLGLGLKL